MPRNLGSAKGAKARADDYFSRIIRARGHCEACQRTPAQGIQLQTAHVISRRYSATRTDERNAFCLCAACHYHFTDHPVEWARWAVAKMGEETYDALFSLASFPTKVDWHAEAARLKERLSTLDRNG